MLILFDSKPVEKVELVESSRIGFKLPPRFAREVSVMTFISPVPITFSDVVNAHPGRIFTPISDRVVVHASDVLFAGEKIFQFEAPYVSGISVWRERAKLVYLSISGSSFGTRNGDISVQTWNLKRKDASDPVSPICTISFVDDFSGTNFVCSIPIMEEFELQVTVFDMKSNKKSFVFKATEPSVAEARVRDSSDSTVSPTGKSNALLLTGRNLLHTGGASAGDAVRYQTVVYIVFKDSFYSTDQPGDILSRDPYAAAVGIEKHSGYDVTDGLRYSRDDGSLYPSHIPQWPPEPWLRFHCYPNAMEAQRIACDIPPGLGRKQSVLVSWGGVISPVETSPWIAYKLPQVSFVSQTLFSTQGGILVLRGSNFGIGPSVHNASITVVPLHQEDCGSTAECDRRFAPQQCIPLSTWDVEVLREEGTLASGFGVLGASGEPTEAEGFSMLLTAAPASVYWNNTFIACRFPEGVARSVRLEFRISTEKTPLLALEQWEGNRFRYRAPSLILTFPTLHPTHGKIKVSRNGGRDAYDPSFDENAYSLVELVGKDFSDNGNVSVGGQPCLVVQWNHTRIVCQMPVGRGTDLEVSVFNLGQYSTCDGAKRNATIAIHEHPSAVLLDYGVNQYSTFDPNLLSFISTARGADSRHRAITALPQVAPACTVSYLRPLLLDVSPREGPAAGGNDYLLTLIGHNFGTRPIAYQRMNRADLGIWQQPYELVEVYQGRPDAPDGGTVVDRHSRLTVQALGGIGRDHRILVLSDGDSRKGMAKAINIGYLPPEVYQVIPHEFVATAPSTRLRVLGKHFGPAGYDDIQVLVGGEECSAVTKAFGNENFELICVLQPPELPPSALVNSSALDLTVPSFVVGSKQLSVIVGGQRALDTPTLQAVCGKGFTGSIGERCKLCPEGAYCPGGVESPISLPTFWRIDRLQFHRCTPSEACRGGFNGTHQMIERRGNFLPLASQLAALSFTNHVSEDSGQTGELSPWESDLWTPGLIDEPLPLRGLWEQDEDLDDDAFMRILEANSSSPGGQDNSTLYAEVPENDGRTLFALEVLNIEPARLVAYEVELDETGWWPVAGHLYSQCSAQYTGEECDSCVENYYRPNPTNLRCIPCPDQAWVLMVLFLVAIILIATLGVYIKKRGVSLNLLGVTIAADFLQALAMFAAFGFPWPPEILALFNFGAFWTMSVQVAAAECSITMTFKQKWIFLQAAFLVYLGMYLIISSILLMKAHFKRWWRARQRKKRWHFVKYTANEDEHVHFCCCGNRSRKAKASQMDESETDEEGLSAHQRGSVAQVLDDVIGIGILSLYVLYFVLARSALEVFDCSKNALGEWRLDADFAILCWTEGEDQLQLVPYAICSVIFYVVGIPLTFLCVVLMKRKDVIRDQWLYMHSMGHVKESNPLWFFRSRYNKLYRNFHPTAYYWKFVLLMRKLGLVVVGLFFDKYIRLQVSSFLCCCLDVDHVRDKHLCRHFFIGSAICHFPTNRRRWHC